MEIIGFQPDAAFIANCELAHRDVSPDVPAQTLEPDAAQPADLEAVSGGFDQETGLGEKHSKACADDRQRKKGRQTQPDGCNSPGQPRARFGGAVFRGAQKLWPMLT